MSALKKNSSLCICLRPVMSREPAVPGTITGICASCEKPIWISPSSQKLKTVVYVCAICAVENIKRTKRSYELLVSQEQAREIERFDLLKS